MEFIFNILGMHQYYQLRMFLTLYFGSSPNSFVLIFIALIYRSLTRFLLFSIKSDLLNCLTVEISPRVSKTTGLSRKNTGSDRLTTQQVLLLGLLNIFSTWMKHFRLSFYRHQRIVFRVFEFRRQV